MKTACIFRSIGAHRSWIVLLAVFCSALYADAEPDSDSLETRSVGDSCQPVVQQEELPHQIRQGTIEFRPADWHANVPEPFRLAVEKFPFEECSVDAASIPADATLITFPSPMRTPHVNNNTVHCEYFRPRTAGRRPGVIVLHILGGSFELSRICCRALTSQGTGALFVKMPYYGPRRQADSDARMISDDPYQTVRGMTQAVLDVRRAAAWLAAQKEIDPDQLGITGISLGGIVSALAFSIEPRFHKGCFVLAGGDFADAYWDLPSRSTFHKQWAADGKSKADLQELFRSIDPLTYATNPQGRKILMFNAKYDEVIPYQGTLSLWKAFGEPEIVWWHTGHYNAIWGLPSCLLRMSEFFQPNAP